MRGGLRLPAEVGGSRPEVKIRLLPVSMAFVFNGFPLQAEVTGVNFNFSLCARIRT